MQCRRAMYLVGCFTSWGVAIAAALFELPSESQYRGLAVALGLACLLMLRTDVGPTITKIGEVQYRKGWHDATRAMSPDDDPTGGNRLGRVS